MNNVTRELRENNLISQFDVIRKLNSVLKIEEASTWFRYSREEMGKEYKTKKKYLKKRKEEDTVIHELGRSRLAGNDRVKMRDKPVK